MEIIITWPESQNVMERPGYRSHSRLIDGEQGLEKYGSSAYLVDDEWWQSDDDNEFDDLDAELYIVGDDELRDLGFLD